MKRISITLLILLFGAVASAPLRLGSTSLTNRSSATTLSDRTSDTSTSLSVQSAPRSVSVVAERSRSEVEVTDTICWKCFDDTIAKVVNSVKRDIAKIDSISHRVKSNIRVISENNQTINIILHHCSEASDTVAPVASTSLSDPEPRSLSGEVSSAPLRLRSATTLTDQSASVAEPRSLSGAEVTDTILKQTPVTERSRSDRNYEIETLKKK